MLDNVTFEEYVHSCIGNVLGKGDTCISYTFTKP